MASGITKPIKHILDKEASAELKAAIKANFEIQMVPSDNKRANADESAMKMYKNYMILVLVGVSLDFQMHL